MRDLNGIQTDAANGRRFSERISNQALSSLAANGLTPTVAPARIGGLYSITD
jgi:hypothetical protein